MGTRGSVGAFRRTRRRSGDRPADLRSGGRRRLVLRWYPRLPGEELYATSLEPAHAPPISIRGATPGTSYQTGRVRECHSRYHSPCMERTARSQHRLFSCMERAVEVAATLSRRTGCTARSQRALSRRAGCTARSQRTLSRRAGCTAEVAARSSRRTGCTVSSQRPLSRCIACTAS